MNKIFVFGFDNKNQKTGEMEKEKAIVLLDTSNNYSISCWHNKDDSVIVSLLHPFDKTQSIEFKVEKQKDDNENLFNDMFTDSITDDDILIIDYIANHHKELIEPIKSLNIYYKAVKNQNILLNYTDPHIRRILTVKDTIMFDDHAVIRFKDRENCLKAFDKIVDNLKNDKKKYLDLNEFGYDETDLDKWREEAAIEQAKLKKEKEEAERKKKEEAGKPPKAKGKPAWNPEKDKKLTHKGKKK